MAWLWIGASGLIGLVAMVVWILIHPKKNVEGSLADKAKSKGLPVASVERLTAKYPTLKRAPNLMVQNGKDFSGVMGLQGNLKQTPLHDLLQYLSLGNKSGVLELASGRRTGHVVIKSGKVSKNSYRGKDGLEAIYMMMDLSEGDFEFYEQTFAENATEENFEVVDIIMLWMDRKPSK